MKILYGTGYDDEERKSFIPLIHQVGLLAVRNHGVCCAAAARRAHTGVPPCRLVLPQNLMVSMKHMLEAMRIFGIALDNPELEVRGGREGGGLCRALECSGRCDRCVTFGPPRRSLPRSF